MNILAKLEAGTHIAKIVNKKDKERTFISEAKVICTTLSTASNIKLK